MVPSEALKSNILLDGLKTIVGTHDFKNVSRYTLKVKIIWLKSMLFFSYT